MCGWVHYNTITPTHGFTNKKGGGECSHHNNARDFNASTKEEAKLKTTEKRGGNKSSNGINSKKKGDMKITGLTLHSLSRLPIGLQSFMHQDLL